MEPKQIGLTAAEALDELAKLLLPPPRLPSDLTTDQMSAAWGLSVRTVQQRMVELVKQGLYEHIKVLDNGAIVQVYRRLNHDQ